MGLAAAEVAPDSNTKPGLGRYRWSICALLFFATTINYMDRQILSLLKPILDNELHWTNEQFGEVNAAFQAAYAVGLLGFGSIIDRFGTRIGYALSIAAWSLAAIGHSFVGSVGGFLRARVALGLGEGGNFPSAIKAVAQWFPKRERAYATAIFNSGANVGAIIAPAIIPWLAFTWGWRSAFVAAGLAGLIWLLFWIPLYDVPEKSRRVSAEELLHIQSDGLNVEKTEKISPWLLLRHRQTWSFIVAKFMTDPVWWFFLIWLPDYFKKTRGLDIKHSWIHLVSIYVVVTILSVIGGWLTGALVTRGYSVSRARKTAMFVSACLVVPIFVVTQVGDWSAVLLIGLAGAAHQAWSANLFTTASDMFPKRAVASVVGIGGMAGSLGGILFPLYSGKLLDRFQASGNITAGYAVLFAICGFAYLVAFVINHLLAPKFEQIESVDF
ncbi:MAG TPA: MFS transporter [Polyangiaceae bacterium]|jgi:ACS family hexuronate transporter-like MFS transporter|nr:MFS transporter [Polyangiaceae bacterium]